MKPNSLPLLVLIGLTTTMAPAAPPPPPPGYKWVSNDTYTDEFDGTALDPAKWFDHHPRWKGRPPAKFVPEAVSVADGCLRIRSGTLAPPDGEFRLFGGAVVSRQTTAHFGYYEARMKASRISMSSTFWLSNSAAAQGDRMISQELDIVEAIGAPQRYPDWHRLMKSNTHVFHTPPGGKKTSLPSAGQAVVDPPAGEAFHIYAAWWVDASTVHFYLNDVFQFTLHPREDFGPAPFHRPMHMNLVTETYDWETPPTAEAVNDPARNTTLYDWVRSWVLVKIEPAPMAAPP